MIDINKISVKQNWTRLGTFFDPERFTIEYDDIDNKYNLKQKSHLIELLLLRVPTHMFIMYFDKNYVYHIVDGIVLKIYQDFINNKFSLIGLDYLTQYENKNFELLPPYIRREIKAFKFDYILIESTTPENVKWDLIKKLQSSRP